MKIEKSSYDEEKVPGLGTLGEQTPEWQIVLSNINKYSKDMQDHPDKWPNEKLQRFISKVEEEMHEKAALREDFISLATQAGDMVLERVPLMSNITKKSDAIDSIRNYAMDKIKELQDLQKSDGANQEIQIAKYKTLVEKANQLEQGLKLAA